MTRKFIFAVCLAMLALPLIQGCKKGEEPASTATPPAGQAPGRQAKVNPETGDRG